jgi:import inner membrane translocase subunit TIM50
MEPVRSNLLPDPVKYPFYQPKYTLVMEMKHLLVHPQWDVCVNFKLEEKTEKYIKKQINNYLLKKICKKTLRINLKKYRSN